MQINSGIANRCDSFIDLRLNATVEYNLDILSAEAPNEAALKVFRQVIRLGKVPKADAEGVAQAIILSPIDNCAVALEIHRSMLEVPFPVVFNRVDCVEISNYVLLAVPVLVEDISNVM